MILIIVTFCFVKFNEQFVNNRKEKEPPANGRRF